jgi:hypothetical protein
MLFILFFKSFWVKEAQYRVGISPPPIIFVYRSLVTQRYIRTKTKNLKNKPAIINYFILNKILLRNVSSRAK